ncbi:MAG: hypothetical protein M1308_24450 [Actinobacteria bacterium]|nr:hypothetical protein [Actinomycetota bacterium]
MRCYLTDTKSCNLKIVEKSNQIFIAYNYKYKNVGNIIEQTVLPALKILKIEYKIAKEELRTKDFFCKICELIQESRYFLANLTNPNFNVGLELGLALGLNKNIILISSRRAKLPSNLIRQEVLLYSNDKEELKNKIIKLFKKVTEKSQNFDLVFH